MCFGIVWAIIVLDYIKNFVVTYGAASYYWDSDSSHEGSACLKDGFYLAHGKHFGSICAGASIIAVITILKWLFVMAAKKAALLGGKGTCVRCCIRCGECYLYCLEKICDYINATAYAQMAVTGEPFLKAAWSGFMLNVKHAGEFGMAKIVAYIVVLLGKIAIIIGNVFTLLLILNKMGYDHVKTSTKEEQQARPNEYRPSLAGPIILCIIITWINAETFLGIIE